MAVRRTEVLKCIYWSVEERENEQDTVFHISGRTVEDKSVYVIVEGFRIHALLEVPKKVNTKSITTHINQLTNKPATNKPINNKPINNKPINKPVTSPVVAPSSITQNPVVAKVLAKSR
jgi:hypothetical protein